MSERGELTQMAVNRRSKQIKVAVECTPMNTTGKAIEGALILMEEQVSPERSQT